MERAPIYMDHNASAPAVPEARAAVAAALALAGNASSVHAFGRRARQAIDQARARVAALVGAAPEAVVFTSGGTEANNLALAGALGRRAASRSGAPDSLGGPDGSTPGRRAASRSGAPTSVGRPGGSTPGRRAGLGEFGRIERFFAPLSASFSGAKALTDDCATFAPPRGGLMVAKTDTIVGGVHTIGDEPADLVARKALRANLSDLAAKGARPFAYLLSLSVPSETADAWVKRFAEGLKRDQREFGLVLVGGDSVVAPGPVSVAITVLGHAPRGDVPRRGDARAGDDIYVTGTIGDAALGLLALRGRLRGIPSQAGAFLADRYRLPRPRLEAGRALAPIVHAMMDISDGLVGDLGHICKWSRLGATIDWPLVPLSPAAKAALGYRPALRATALGGGDDYELLFTASPRAAGRVASAARRAGIRVTRIGRMAPGRGARVVDAAGGDITPARGGYQHR
ncbi:MAG: thiamine-phosphate kinase [Rhodospirillales bacterium]